MEILCPSCGKYNQAAPCQRCGCDLTPLFAIRQAAGMELADAAAALRSGDALGACGHAASSWELHHSAEAARMGLLACIAAKDFSSALAWRNRVL